MARRKKIRWYVLKVTMPEERKVAFIKIDDDGVGLTDDLHEAKRYPSNIEDSKGSPQDWATFIGQEYGYQWCEPMMIYVKDEK